jgi:hypothetical protein
VAEEFSDNPEENQLPDWAAAGELEKAATAAGYPLQITVGNLLKNSGFFVQDEPTYVDSDGGSETTRTLDLAARLPLTPKLLHSGDKALDLYLTLLIECKRSVHPYVFFEAVNPPSIESLPSVGLRREVRFTGDWDDHAVRSAPLMQALGVHQEALIVTPPISATFSRAIRGKKIEFSGEEPYRAIVLPLIKAVQYQQQVAPRRHTAQLMLPVAVVDAPMAMVGFHGEIPYTRSHPWLRVIRWRATKPDERFVRRGFDAVDIVHRAYFGRYVHEYLMPFGFLFAQRLGERLPFVLDGHIARVSDLDKNDPLPDDLFDRLEEE